MRRPFRVLCRGLAWFFVLCALGSLVFFAVKMELPNGMGLFVIDMSLAAMLFRVAITPTPDSYVED